MRDARRRRLTTHPRDADRMVGAETLADVPLETARRSTT